MRQITFISVVIFTMILCLDNAGAQNNILSFRPYFNIEKSIYNADSEMEYNTSQTDIKYIHFKQADFLSFGGTIKYGMYFSNLSIAAPWGNGADMDFTPSLDLNLGIQISDYSCFIGYCHSMGGEYNYEYDVISPLYAGFQTDHLWKGFYLKNSLQYKIYETKNDPDYNSISLTSRFYRSTPYISPYIYLTVEKWNLKGSEQDDFFDNTNFNMGIGITFANCSQITSNAMRIFGRFTTVRKPNIYLYPEKPCSVEVKVEPNGVITESIPEYNDGWKVLANPDGSIPGTEGFLFYEASVDVDKPSFGWCIHQNDLIKFFKETLSRIGLNKQEISDFIEYWEKELTSAPYYSIYPVFNENIDNVCPLAITPAPDKILRVWFIFEPQETFRRLAEPETPHFEREGFAVTEWGGIILE